jgi:hypothetical protein
MELRGLQVSREVVRHRRCTVGSVRGRAATLELCDDRLSLFGAAGHSDFHCFLHSGNLRRGGGVTWVEKGAGCSGWAQSPGMKKQCVMIDRTAGRGKLLAPVNCHES